MAPEAGSSRPPRRGKRSAARYRGAPKANPFTSPKAGLLITSHNRSTGNAIKEMYALLRDHGCLAQPEEVANSECDLLEGLEAELDASAEKARPSNLHMGLSQYAFITWQGAFEAPFSAPLSPEDAASRLFAAAAAANAPREFAKKVARVMPVQQTGRVSCSEDAVKVAQAVLPHVSSAIEKAVPAAAQRFSEHGEGHEQLRKPCLGLVVKVRACDKVKKEEVVLPLEQALRPIAEGHGVRLVPSDRGDVADVLLYVYVMQTVAFAGVSSCQMVSDEFKVDTAVAPPAPTRSFNKSVKYFGKRADVEKDEEKE